MPNVNSFPSAALKISCVPSQEIISPIILMMAPCPSPLCVMSPFNLGKVPLILQVLLGDAMGKFKSVLMLGDGGRSEK